MRLVFDIETNGLDPDTIWLVVAQDLATGEQHVFTDHEDCGRPLGDFVELFDRAEALIGHNIISFDLPVLKKLTGWEPTTQTLVDTMLLSQMNDFERPNFEPFLKNKFGGRHNMKVWSLYLGNEEKHDDPSWLEYSEEMRERCTSDVRINVHMYRAMMAELKTIREYSDGYGQAVKLEHDFALNMAQQAENGWLVDLDACTKLVRKIEVEMSDIELEVEPQLKPRTIYLDKEPREAKKLKDGRWDRVTRDWFEKIGQDVTSPYQRYRVVDMKLGNNEAVIDLLMENGWKPDDWNWGVDADGRFFKRSPKLTESSFDSISGDLGRLVGRWRILRSRKAFVEGLLKNAREDSRVSCQPAVIGTNTYRCRHRGIVNVPGAYAVLGEEVRRLFIAPDGRKVVAADSDSNQLRAFAHYLKNDDVSAAITSGSSDDGTDVHTRTATLAGVSRPVAKNLTYALLFGAGDGKLAETAGTGEAGGQIRERLEAAFPGFKKLTDRIKYQWEVNRMETGRGFVYGLDGRRVYCEQYKAFNALLQAYEAVVMKRSCVKVMEMVEAQGLDAKLICHYHDEINMDVAEKDAEAVSEILEYALGDYVTEYYSLDIEMGGTAVIGRDWYDVH